MKYIFAFVALFISIGLSAQNVNADCIQAIPLCSTPSFTFNATSGVGNVNDIPSNANVSNPTTNPASNNSGCLLAGELKPQWLLITIGNAGFLEFSFGAATSAHPQAGFYDWAMWPYSPTTCSDIQNNLLAPVRCNWNGSASGGTGIASSTNIPSGGSPANYEPPLAVQACQQFIICISNYSGVNTLVSFQSLGTASLSCNPSCLSVTNPTICWGTSASIVASSSSTTSSLTYSINPGGITSSTPTFVVNPQVTTSYTVYATGLNSQNVPVTQTAVSTVLVKTQPTVAPTFTNSTCTNTFNAFDLHLSFNPSSPVPSYTVLWSSLPNGITSPTQTAAGGNIAPGVYTATVIAAGSCSTVATITIDPPPSPAMVTLVPTGPVYTVTCFEPVITVTALSASYNYTWTNGLIASINGNQGAFTNTMTGTWTITAENPVSGCVSTKTLVVGINTVQPVSALSPSFQSINCNLSSVTPVTLTAVSPTVNIVQNVLSPNGGTFVANSASVAYQPGGVGEYTYSIVNGVNGCQTTKVFTVTSSMGFPTFSLTSTPLGFTLGCNTKSATIVNITNGNTTPPGGAVSYTLLSPSASSVTPSGSLSSISTYTINSPGLWTAITKDNVSFCETRVPFSVLSNTFAPPIDTVIIPSQVLSCDIPRVTLKGVSNSTPADVSYNWSFPGTPGNQAGDTISVFTRSNETQTLVANYTLTITDLNNTCRAATVIPIYQNIFKPKALITNGGTASLTCNTNTIMLTNSSSSGIQGSFFPKNLPVVAYLWQGPSPQLDGQLTSNYVAYVPGTYTLIAKDLNNGCTSATVLPVYENRQFPVINNPVVPPPAALDCGMSAATLSPNITPTNNLAFFWRVVEGAHTTPQNLMLLSTDKAGIYQIVATNTLNGCVSAANMSVVTGSLTAAFEPDRLTGYAPLDVNFTNNSTSSTSSSSILSVWSLGNGLTATNTVGSSVSTRYNAPGIYTVTLFASKGLCADTAKKVIVVEVPSALDIPNIFTPNGDGVNDEFFLKTANLTSISMVIANRWGEKVYSIESETGNVLWDGTNQQGKEAPDGVYYYTLKASGADGKQFERKGTVTLLR